MDVEEWAQSGVRAAPQDLDKHLPELSGGQVVEEGVSHGGERHIAPEEIGGPAGLGQRCHHNAADLGGEPAQHQGGNNEPWKKWRQRAREAQRLTSRMVFLLNPPAR
uniref:Uncharacterized protein n=1 Tax=Takifugu rubripes TaxID=31033 RepID=A0A3B5K1M9_TAKRU